MTGKVVSSKSLPKQDAEYMDANKDIAVDKGATLKKSGGLSSNAL